MAQSSISINFPFPFTEITYREFKITNNILVSDIIHSALPNANSKPEDYGIYAKPQNKWLLPDVLLESYRFQLTSPSAIYEFRPKSLKVIKINVLFSQIRTYCDPQQPINIVVKNAATIVNSSYRTSDFSVENTANNQFIPSPQPVSLVFEDNNSIPILRARFELPKKDSPNVIFKGTIDYALSRENNNGKVPSFFNKLLELIDGFRDSVGIYRLSGDFSTIENICQHIDQTTDIEELSQFLSQQKPNELACVVKQYLRQLSEPLIPTFFEKDFRDILTIDDFCLQMQRLKVLIQSLPYSHYNLFQEFCRHIEGIIQLETNQMDAKNLAICIGTNILRASNPATVVQDTQGSQTLFQLIFENWRFLFLDEKIDLGGNGQNFVTPFEDYAFIKTILTVSDDRYLIPDDPKHALSTIDLKSKIRARVAEAKEIGRQMDEVMSKLAKDPSNKSLNKKLLKLKEKYTYL